MPILGLQQQQTEVGRIRLGVMVKTAKGKEAPSKLDRLRFTSPRKTLIERIAELYGGTVEPWQPPRGNQQWQVITNTAEVPVLVPPQDPGESQWYELWSAGGCQRRCDGQTEKLSQQSCLCDPAARDCSMHTRLRVMLEDVPGMGAWRVDTGSYYAAVELPGIAALLAQAQGIIPAKLILHQRTVVRGGKTMHFAVPVLDTDEWTSGQLISGRVQELVAARRSAAIDGQVRAAIEAKVDYPGLIDAARTVEALFELHTRVKKENGGQVPDDLMRLFEQRAAAIRAGTPQAAPAAVIDVEVASAPAEDVDDLWAQIIERSPWDDAEELEANFIRVVGHPSDEASAEDMRKFIAAIETVEAAA